MALPQGIAVIPVFPGALGGAHQAATTACLQRSRFFQASLLCHLSEKMKRKHGSLNVPIEHHPTIRYPIFHITQP